MVQNINIYFNFALFLGSVVSCFLITRRVLKFLSTYRIYDVPNGRSCHLRPVPVGGGWAILFSVFPLWVLASWFAGVTLNGSAYLLIFEVFVLAIVFWKDDLNPISPFLRLLVQLGAVVIMLLTLPEDVRIFGLDWPVYADRVLTGLCWLWFINLFNFMDGVDGMATSEAIFVALGIAAVSLFVPYPDEYRLLALALGGAGLGFLYFNWQPAKLFLGDVGSITIGYILGWMLIQLAISGAALAAFILPACFLADASITIGWRILSLKRIWRPHREHFYQRAVLSGFHTHGSVVSLTGLGNALLVVCALFSLQRPYLATVSAAIVVLITLTLMVPLVVKIIQSQFETSRERIGVSRSRLTSFVSYLKGY